jgi:hypothetical protein
MEMQRQRVHRPGELPGQHLMDQPVALHPGQGRETFGYQRHLEVGLGTRGDVVSLTLVLDPQQPGRQGRAQFGFDLLLNGHGRSPVQDGFRAGGTRMQAYHLRAAAAGGSAQRTAAGIRAALGAIERHCAGGEEAGQAARDDAGRRFRWLIAPRSTVVQPGPVHTGLTTDPAAETERLLDLLVR